MKVLLSFILFILIATEIKAQAVTSSLQITLSDVQSVQIVELPAQSESNLSKKKSIKKNISILNPGAAQIRTFESLTGKTELLFQQNSNGSQLQFSEPVVIAYQRNMQMANLTQQANKAVPIVVYQIDPR